MSLPYHIWLLPSAHLEESHDVGILPAVRYDTTAGFYLVLEKYRTASGITDRISADDLILIVTIHRIKVPADTAEVLLLPHLSRDNMYQILNQNTSSLCQDAPIQVK